MCIRDRWASTGRVPAIVSGLMVLPVLWGNVCKGISQTDGQLLEAARAYRFGRWKTLRLVYVPSVLQMCIRDSARTDPRTVRQENGKGGVIYAPHAFRRCLGVVLEGRVQVNKGALIMSVLEPGDLFGAAALFNDRADYATTLTARAPCRVLLLRCV